MGQAVINRERFREQYFSGYRDSSDDRLPLRLKTVVPDNVEQLLDMLWQIKDEFPQTIACWTCNTPLILREVKFDWAAGSYSFYFPGAPAYRCDICCKTYLPEAVREKLAECVEVELK